MQPEESITEMLSGSIKLESQELIDEIVESEDWADDLDDWIWEVIHPSKKIKD
jgi:hypothetical protein